MSTTMLSLLADLADRSPHAPFLSDGPNSVLTYGAAYILATQCIPLRLAQLCPEIGQRPQVKVALVSHNNALYPLVLWALWSIGAVAVPLSISADPSMWIDMACVAHAETILAGRDLVSKFHLEIPGLRENRPTVVELESLIPSEHFNPEDRGPDTLKPFGLILACNRWACRGISGFHNLAAKYTPFPGTPIVTLFTSSAIDAATLKCVTYTHAILVESCVRTIKALGGDSYSRTPKRHLGWLPLSHCFEFTVSLCGIVLMTGGTYVLHDPRVSSPSLSGAASLSVVLLESLVHHQPIQSFCTVPAILEKLPGSSSSRYLTALRALDSLCVGGAPSSRALYDWAAGEHIQFVDYLGATEVAGGLCTRRIHPHSVDGLSVMDGLMGVLEKENIDDDVGELIVVGKNLPQRYDNKESRAFTTPSDGVTVYRTGDLYGQYPGATQRSIGRGSDLPPYDPDTTPLSGLYYKGRLDDIVTLNSGVKIDALSLERVLDSLPGVRRSAVVLNSEGDSVVALIETDVTMALPPATIIDAVLRTNTQLPFEKRILRENIQFVSVLPVTTKSTLHRRQVKKIVHDAGGLWPQTAVHYPPPQKNHSSSVAAHTPFPRSTMSSAPDQVLKELRNLIPRTLGILTPDVINPALSLSDLGMSSLASVRLATAIKESFTVDLKTSQLFGIRTIAELCNWIVQAQQKPEHDSAQRNLSAQPPEPQKQDGLAITGASCRFPGGINSLANFWDAIVSPQETSNLIARSTPPSRWPDAVALDLPHMGWIDGLESDDIMSFATFFELKPSDVKAMTYNARLALKMAYGAIEDAGIAPRSLDGKPWAVFSSVNDSGWRERRLAEAGLEEYGRTWNGVADDAVGARLSYLLNLTGPAVEVKTACSSSAVAVHQACAAIRNGDCEAAIVVSVTTNFFPASGIFRKSAGIASPLGRCATFSKDADGFLPSEGAAAIVIQKAADARGEIYAYIRGSAVTQNGRSQGFAAPNPVAQARLLDMAFHHSGIVPDDISYIETHGTGTRLGDAIEIDALNSAFGHRRTRPLLIGTVKSVIGHTEECAGLAGIIKSLLCFRHNVIPPQANFSTANAEIDLFSSRLVIPSRVTAFIEYGRPRLIGVSSFGLSGTLAHITLQEPSRSPIRPTRSPAGGVFVISARSSADLSVSIASWLAYAESPLSRESNVEDICFTTKMARDVFPYRYAWSVSDWKALLSRLRQASSLRNHPRSQKQPSISIWFGAPRGDHRHLPIIDHPVYRSTIAECAASVEGGLSSDLEYYARQLALSRTLVSLGCKVVVVGGEGPGEFVAAAFAGVFDITGLFHFLTEMEPLEGQEASSFEAPQDIILERLSSFGTHQLRMRAQHGAGQTTIIGTKDAMQRFRILNTDLICSGVQDALSLRLRRFVALPLVRGQYSLVSAHVGQILDQELLLKLEYWNGLLSRDFSAQCAWDRLSEQSDLTINLGGAEFTPPNGIAGHPVERNAGGVDGPSADALLARIFEAGCDIEWHSLSPRGSLVRLPTYQWAITEK